MISALRLNLVRGILVIVALYVASRFFGFVAMEWIFGKLATVLVFGCIVIFQPELRKFLERLGKWRFLSPFKGKAESSVPGIKHLLTTVESLSKNKIGALIVLEVSDSLEDYIQSGISIFGEVSSELLVTLFWPNTPTHDGAVIIKDNQISAAGCLLPLTDTRITDRRLGTRHRAAIGLSELTDAVVIVISEETGTISLAEHGNLTRFLTKEALETRLFNLYRES